jgi:anti-sigma regulatory factor (Ser/Thr protein kinase)/biotin operon repressor
MPPKSKEVKEEIREMLRAGPVSSGEVATQLGITRQAAHYHLRRMLEDGEIIRLGPGHGRGTKYVENAVASFAVTLDAAEEDEVWSAQMVELEPMRSLGRRAHDIHQYAFTEMLNNAIEHSEGTTAQVRIREIADGLEVSVHDDGIGAFTKIARETGMPPDEVVGELSKGKLTSDPSRHTGEGIFFTSKAVARFVLESDGKAYVVEGGLDEPDWAIGPSRVKRGTRVTWDIPGDPPHPLNEVFGRFAPDDSFEFSRTATHVGLFSGSRSLISRSEARRLAKRLEGFDVVTIDFSGIELVGQGFADELFRVWAWQHPDITLVPVNAGPEVAQMIERVRAPNR